MNIFDGYNKRRLQSGELEEPDQMFPEEEPPDLGEDGAAPWLDVVKKNKEDAMGLFSKMRKKQQDQEGDYGAPE